MVEKVKNLNWPLYSDIGLVLANLIALCSVVILVLNTKNLNNSSVIIYYLILGLMAMVLLKLNHAASNE